MNSKPDTAVTEDLPVPETSKSLFKRRNIRNNKKTASKVNSSSEGEYITSLNFKYI